MVFNMALLQIIITTIMGCLLYKFKHGTNIAQATLHICTVPEEGEVPESGSTDFTMEMNYSKMPHIVDNHMLDDDPL